MTITASDETQEIDYRSCDTIETPVPPAPRWWHPLADRWEDIWPPLVGVVLGISIGTALLLLTALWWLNT